jgi:hypothetical protein
MTYLPRIVVVVLTLASSLVVARRAPAACHAVNPANAHNGDGTSWVPAASDGAAGAYNTIPTTLTRGDVYYLADGSYGSYTFATPDSGTATVELRKAQPHDHGSTCSTSMAAGWNTATMGSAQAVFSSTGASLDTETDYLIVNGNGTSSAPGCGGAPGGAVNAEPPTPSDCGIGFVGLGGTTSGSLNLIYMNAGSKASSNVSFKYVELFGSGTNNQGGNGDLEVFFGGDHVSFEHVYGHNSGCVYIQDMGNDSLVDHSYFWGTEVNGALGSSACHGQAEFESGGRNGGVRSNNVYRDITGTAVWTFASGGANSGWEFYGNVVFFSSPKEPFGGITDAALDCINGNLCTDFTYVQNTVVNCLDDGVFGSAQCGIGWGDSASGGSVVVENNLYYSNSGGINLTTNGTTVTENYNSFLNSGAFGSGAQDVHMASGAPNPLVNWQSSNFNLESETADWNNRLALGAPYTTDPNGTTRTTDRGAYQYCSTGCVATEPDGGSPMDGSVAPQPPAPPTDLTATAK